MNNRPKEAVEKQLIMSLVAKVAELDKQVMGLAGIRIGVLAELEEIQGRLSEFEEKQLIIEKKLNQRTIPSLLKEFKCNEKDKLSNKNKTSRKNKKGNKNNEASGLQ